ncbi:cell division protein FtsX [uncultured Sphingomonas sp.]|uniref:cell division protein FtsX n=1 Tax=uncultured Sphingomonas sp. TaxID=158754 RepID=UPI0035C9E456
MTRAINGIAHRRVLEERRSTRAMSWVMAIMLFLTVLASATGLATINAAATLDRQLAGRLTVQIVDPDAARRARSAAMVLATLRALPLVARAAPVDRGRLAVMLAPWLGKESNDADLPIPALIDVDLTMATDDAVGHVAAAVRAAAPTARIDQHSRWLSPVARFMRVLIAVAGMLVLLMAAATTAVVLLAVRAGLETHRETIQILHMLGSTDVQIARLFQRRIALDTLAGGAIGGAAAIGAVAFMAGQAATLDSELVGGAVLVLRDWLVLACLPLAFAMLATIAARLTVIRQLGRTL